MRTISETSGTMLMPQHSNHRVPEEDKKKDHEKILDLTYLRNKGYSVDMDDLENAIEAAVLKLHNELSKNGGGDNAEQS